MRAVLGPKLDVRGDGGYVLVPPSIHISGTQYEWINAAAEIAEAPARLIALVCGDKPGQAEETQTIQQDAEIAEGTRNESLFKLGCAMRGDGA